MSYEPVLGPEAVLEGREAKRHLHHRCSTAQEATRECPLIFLSIYCYRLASFFHLFVQILDDVLLFSLLACRRDREEAERHGEQETTGECRVLWKRRTGECSD